MSIPIGFETLEKRGTFRITDLVVGGRFLIHSSDKRFGEFLQHIVADISYDLIAKTLTLGFYEIELKPESRSTIQSLEEWIKSDHSQETIAYSNIDELGNISLDRTFSSLEVISDIFSNNYHSSNPPIRRVTLKYDSRRYDSRNDYV